MTEYSKTRSAGADIELIEYCENPEAVEIVVPNAVVINGQRTWCSADHPIEVEYTDGDPSIALVTVTLQVRSLVIEARQKPQRDGVPAAPAGTHVEPGMLPRFINHVQRDGRSDD